MDDLARELGLPVILVVGMRLGCLSHALLTARAVRAAGLPLAAWVANHVDPDMAAADENVAALTQRLGAPLLARLAFAPGRDPQEVSRELNIAHLQLASAR
jgi:dethiobiotin synthetase